MEDSVGKHLERAQQACEASSRSILSAYVVFGLCPYVRTIHVSLLGTRPVATSVVMPKTKPPKGELTQV